jgi:hypothetical protein
MDTNSILLFLIVSLMIGIAVAIADTSLRDRQHDREDARRRNRR